MWKGTTCPHPSLVLLSMSPAKSSPCTEDRKGSGASLPGKQQGKAVQGKAGRSREKVWLYAGRGRVRFSPALGT